MKGGNRMAQKITGKLINKVLNFSLPDVYYGNTLGLVDDIAENNDIAFITFIDDKNYIKKVNNNKRIKSIFITHQIWNKLGNDHLQPIFCDDPRYYFFSLYNYIAHINYKKSSSIVADSADINTNSYVSPYNVVIGEKSVIEPHVTILPDVEIGNNVIIRSGAVIGSEGFEHKRTSKGILPVFHNSKVVIHDNVEIGANTCIDKGLIKDTVIHEGVKIDNLVHIGHSVSIGKNSLITAGVIISGSAVIGDNVWLSPGVVIRNGVNIGDNSFVGIHSLVIRKVKDNTKVFGIPAVKMS
jgi:UDP-3-O-[3-hydroxymyristoyl] glucosamine N-acyltransferase